MTISTPLRCAIICGLLASIACAQAASARTIFLDTFDDGDAEDGTPVTWVPQTGTWDASSGDYVNTGNGIRRSLVSEHDLADTSVRARVRLDGDSTQTIALGLGVRRTPGPVGYAANIVSDGTVGLYRVDGAPTPNALATSVVPFETVGQDIVLQVDAIGDELSMWVWPIGEPMPADPQVTVTDSTYASGSVGVLGLSFDTIHDATFRFVHVADTHIPEPSSCLLIAVGAGIVMMATRRRKDRGDFGNARCYHVALLALACVLPLPQYGYAEEGIKPEEKRLLETDRAWAAAAAAGNKEQILSNWTDDAVNYFPGEPPAAGKDAIKRLVFKYRSLPGFSLTWQPASASVARASDLGYTHGSFRMTLPGPDKVPMVKRGHYLCIWQRQEDNSWKCIVEMSNFGEDGDEIRD